jgi:hypothetical protein
MYLFNDYFSNKIKVEMNARLIVAMSFTEIGTQNVPISTCLLGLMALGKFQFFLRGFMGKNKQGW